MGSHAESGGAIPAVLAVAVEKAILIFAAYAIQCGSLLLASVRPLSRLTLVRTRTTHSRSVHGKPKQTAVATHLR